MKGPTSTPDLLRRNALLAGVAALVLVLLGTATAARVASRAGVLEDSTGPVLVAAQDVRASLAEANAAQTAAYLALPDQDPVSRRAYEDAMTRVTDQLEEVAARVGDDEAVHQAVKDVSSSVTRYVGLVEAARATGIVAALPSDTTLLEAAADQYLVDAVAQLDGPVDDTVDALVAAADAQFDRDGGADRVLVVATGLVGGALLVLLVVLSVQLAARTRRVLNVGLLVAVVAGGAATAWFLAATLSSETRLREAVDEGYASIEASAQLQSRAFGLQSDAIVLAVRDDSTVRGRIADARLKVGDDVDRLVALADTARERALAVEVSTRLERYLAALQLGEFVSGDDERRAAQIEAIQPFNGFVFALDGVVADNRDQFLTGLDDVASPLSPLPLVMLALGLLAAAAGWLGHQPRIREYQ